jgi:hypothetical protein
MIHYQLRCGTGHEFDGWFTNSAGFERQAATGLIVCPDCGGTDVVRALMAPRLASRHAPAPKVETTSETALTAPSRAAAGPLPDAVRAALTRLRAEVERNCDYVGAEFATEARRIHNGEAAPRGIYGETTPDEAESLIEDGIEVARIPWLPRADS